MLLISTKYAVYLLVNSILNIMVHLQMLYSQLEDQQVDPATLSLLWRQMYVTTLPIL